ncbi:hypothetical protein D3C86_1170950 [compost metagenome]
MTARRGKNCSMGSKASGCTRTGMPVAAPKRCARANRSVSSASISVVGTFSRKAGGNDTSRANGCGAPATQGAATSCAAIRACRSDSPWANA